MADMNDMIGESEALLSKYDAEHRAAAASPGAKGLGGAITANEWADAADRAGLAAAVRALRLAAMPRNGRIMLGICADDAAAGIATLKAWVSELHLPRGVLHGMDKDGVPIDMSEFGAVYIKYNSHSSASGDPAGTAVLSGYQGDFRGVYFNPDLEDGGFRQYAVLPLDLFSTTELASPSEAEASAVGVTAAPDNVRPSSAAQPRLAPGMRVLVRYGGKAAEYAATLVQSRPCGVWDVKYDDGDQETGVKPELIRLRQDGQARSQRLVDTARAVSETAAGAGSRARQKAVTPSSEEAHVDGGGRGVEGDAQPTAMVTPAVPRRFSSARRFDARKSRGKASDDGSGAVAKLHREGWVLLPSSLYIEEATLAAIRSSTFEPIFNGHSTDEAPLRHMGREWQWATLMEERLGAALSSAGLLRCADGIRSKSVRDCYALRSLPLPGVTDGTLAALEGRQPAHSDSPEPPDGGSLSTIADEDFPLSVMLAVQSGTRLWVYPEGCDGPAELLPLRVGDLLVWRGDLVHAGAGYTEEHVRVHAYVDPPPDIFQRPFGKTNRCGL